MADSGGAGKIGRSKHAVRGRVEAKRENGLIVEPGERTLGSTRSQSRTWDMPLGICCWELARAVWISADQHSRIMIRFNIF